MKRFVFALLALALPQTAMADPADIISAEARLTGSGWTFSVTLRHPDTGWDDYADGWRVIGPSGDVLGTRVLHHPHVTEQPFTRSLSGVDIPDDTTVVEIEASTNVTGWSGARLKLTLPAE